MSLFRLLGRGLSIGLTVLFHALIWLVGWLGMLLTFRPKATRQRWQADRLRCLLRDLGATYVKVGQIMSSRPDIFPAHIVKSLERLQDDVGQFAYLLAGRDARRRKNSPSKSRAQNPLRSQHHARSGPNARSHSDDANLRAVRQCLRILYSDRATNRLNSRSQEQRSLSKALCGLGRHRTAHPHSRAVQREGLNDDVYRRRQGDALCRDRSQPNHPCKDWFSHPLKDDL